jgi:cytochrome c oxidase cbb3-type subunit I/II
MPSWGGGINGLLTLRGAWNKVSEDPVLKFYVVGITFYMMSTFEGPMLSVKSVNALSHYTDWTIAHVHAGALGWNGFMTFGMLYWLLPRLFQAPLWSKKLMATHFWISTIGIVLYVLPIYTAGITQGLMWRAFDESGQLQYGNFLQTVSQLFPFYLIRAIGGGMYVVGVVLLGFNALMTWKGRPAAYAEPVHSAPKLEAAYQDAPVPASVLTANTEFAKTVDSVVIQGWFHRVWERKAGKFTVLVIVAVACASLLEIIPTFLIKSNVPTIASVQPYTPLELAGRDIYIAEGCYNCHSQMIRPLWDEKLRYGEYSKPGEFVYDHPFQWGSRRAGPDLQREGGKNSTAWHMQHFEAPTVISPGSLMPSYGYLLKQPLNFEGIQGRVQAMAMLGVPYGEAVKGNRAVEMAREQAEEMAAQLEVQDGNYQAAVMKNTKAIALVAYLQRLGTDLNKPAPAKDEKKAESTETERGREEARR